MQIYMYRFCENAHTSQNPGYTLSANYETIVFSFTFDQMQTNKQGVLKSEQMFSLHFVKSRNHGMLIFPRAMPLHNLGVYQLFILIFLIKICELAGLFYFRVKLSLFSQEVLYWFNC